MANTTNLDLVKPAGTDHALISVLNSNSDKIDAFAGQTNDSLSAEQNGLAYIVGNTNTTGGTLAVGQFVYVKGHSTIPEGLRKVTASISANGSITTSNTDACSEGGLNALNSNKVSKETTRTQSMTCGITSNEQGVYFQTKKQDNNILQPQFYLDRLNFIHNEGGSSWPAYWTLYPNEMGNTISSDLNSITVNRLQIFIWNESTLHSPEKDGITNAGNGVVFSYSSFSGYGVQFSMNSVDRNVPFAKRTLDNGTWTTWTSF